MVFYVMLLTDEHASIINLVRGRIILVKIITAFCILEHPRVTTKIIVIGLEAVDIALKVATMIPIVSLVNNVNLMHTVK